MPDLRSRRTWIPTLAALIALLAFAAQAGATYEEEDRVEGCAATGYHEEYDPCSEGEEPAKPEEPAKDEEPAKPDEESGESEESDDTELPDFRRSFLNRVWKFEGEVDFYE